MRCVSCVSFFFKYFSKMFLLVHFIFIELLRELIFVRSHNRTISIFTVAKHLPVSPAHPLFVIQTAAVRSWLKTLPEKISLEKVLIFVEHSSECKIWANVLDYSPVLLCQTISCADSSDTNAGNTNKDSNFDTSPLLFNCIFREALRVLSSPLIAFVNTDILLFSDFASTAAYLQSEFDSFVAVGQRTDVSYYFIHSSLNPPPAQYSSLRAFKQNGTLHGIYGLDYFVMPRQLWQSLLPFPPFLVGRPAWDNFLLWKLMRRNDVVTVDVTNSVLAMHISYTEIGANSHNRSS